MKKLLLIATLFFLTPWELIAQYNINENKVWVFGYHSGLSFTSGSPGGIISHIDGGSGSSGFLAGCASVSNASGSLLFYCSADSVWDKFGTLMPNGSGLMPNPSSPGTYYVGAGSLQGALIVPVIGTTSQYYVFSLQTPETSTGGDVNAGRLFYSEVDMTLNGGLGDVVPTVKGIKIDSQLSEKLIAIPGNANDVWVVVHAYGSGTFKSFHVTSTGINTTPVISSPGGPATGTEYATGPMKVSPDRTRIAVINRMGPSLQFASFDPNTGIVSGLSSMSTYGGFSGGDFSPDNSKFYVFNKGTNSIDQFNLLLSPMSLVFLAESPIGSNLNLFWPDMRLGPNGKIYVPVDENHLDYINSPNLSGTACNYVGGASVVYVFGSIKFGFGNMYVAPLAPVVPITGPTSVCAGATITLSDATAGGTWSSSNAAIATVGAGTGIVTGAAPGTATISYNAGGSGVATMTVTVNASPTAITGTSLICTGTSAALASSPTGGIWTSSNIAVATVVAATGVVTGHIAGTSVITYAIGGCTVTRVVTVNSSTASITGSVAICPAATATLTATATGGTWSSSNNTIATVGSATGTVTGVAPGTATISYTPSSGCPATKVVTVNAPPSVAPVSGTLTVCVGHTTVATDVSPGGIWSCSNTAIATIAAGSGVVTGVSAGIAVLSYSVTGCGTATAVHIVTVLSPSACLTGSNLPAGNNSPDEIALFPNPNEGVFTLRGNFATNNGYLTLNVKNMLGQIVFEDKIAAPNNNINTQLNLPAALSNGMYTVTLISNGANKTLRFVLNR